MKLVLVRHGQSIWNLENRFTGWTDVDLTQEGINEAQTAGELLELEEYSFDVVYTSVLKRANNTMNIILKQLKQTPKIIKTWRLNERFYGALQGLNKDEARKIYGEEQVKLWRRSSNISPPALEKDDIRFPGNDALYKDVDKKLLPKTENLIDTINRVEPVLNDIKKDLKENKSVLVVAHGNSLRAIIKELENLNEEKLLKLELETGNPIVIELDENFNVISREYIKPPVIKAKDGNMVVEILYGRPIFSKTLNYLLENNLIALGGCIITNESPKYIDLNSKKKYNANLEEIK